MLCSRSYLPSGTEHHIRGGQVHNNGHRCTQQRGVTTPHKHLFVKFNLAPDRVI